MCRFYELVNVFNHLKCKPSQCLDIFFFLTRFIRHCKFLYKFQLMCSNLTLATFFFEIPTSLSTRLKTQISTRCRPPPSVQVPENKETTSFAFVCVLFTNSSIVPVRYECGDKKGRYGIRILSIFA